MKTTRECFEALLAGKRLRNKDNSIVTFLDNDGIISIADKFWDHGAWEIIPNPKEHWVNEYPYRTEIFNSPEGAIKAQSVNCTRVAVLYREVTE